MVKFGGCAWRRFWGWASSPLAGTLNAQINTAAGAAVKNAGSFGLPRTASENQVQASYRFFF